MLITSFSFFSVDKLIVIAIPVADGNTIKSFIKLSPIEWRRFLTNEQVSCTSKDDPTAFGCISFTLPDLIVIFMMCAIYLPIPWTRLKFLFFTMLEYILPSLSPIPIWFIPLFESIEAKVLRINSIVSSSSPSSGTALLFNIFLKIFFLELSN